MFRAFIVCFFIQSVFGKCGVWYDFKRESGEYGPIIRAVINTGGSYNVAGTYSAYNYLFERKSQQLTCNDIEMFEQCKRAQFLLDQFSISNSLPLTTLNCFHNVICSIPPQPTGNVANQYWCQNIDSFELCLNAKNIIDNSTLINKRNFIITCNFALQLNDGFQIFNYSKPGVLTGTTTSLPTTTTFVFTTSPSSASRFAFSLVFLFLSIPFIGFVLA